MFSDPKTNLQQFGIEKGMKVADLGVGAGFYVMNTAQLVGEEGRVYAIDVQKDLLNEVKRIAEHQGLTNVEVIWGNIEKLGGTKIKDAEMDACIVSNVLFQVEDRKGLINEIERILRPGGKVLVIDWLGSFAGLGPHQDMVVTQETAESLFGEKGFKIEKRIDAGDHHYGFIARK